jgi:hypothetical protein
MTIEPVAATHQAPVIALLTELRVSAFGIHSRRLHEILVQDALSRSVDGRIAVEGDDVLGVVLAAPKAYWRTALLRHWDLAFACLRARVRFEGTSAARLHASPPSGTQVPTRTWTNPGEAWRIVFIGTSPAARGRGVAMELYRSMMRDRDLVARIAADNTPSIRLHASLGWQLYPDSGVILAVHLRNAIA